MAYAIRKLGACGCQPFRPALPMTVAIRMTKPQKAEAAAERPGVRRLDEFTVETTTAYLQAAADDIKNKSKSESFPTLVPLAIGRVVRLKPTDPNWPAASDVLYSLLDGILKTTEPMFTGMKKHAKLV